MDDYTYKSFIPVSRDRLVETMVDEGKLDGGAVESFGHLAEILPAFLHFRFHRDLETMKEEFCPFDPDNENLSWDDGEEEEQGDHGDLFAVADRILERANYEKATDEDVQLAFENPGDIPLRTVVDFDDFEEVACYFRNRTLKKRERRKMFLFKDEAEVEVFGRVVVVMRAKGMDYFEEKFAKDKKKKKEKKMAALGFEPGKVYAYLYKDIPAYDLELLFPNVKVGMRMVDRLMLGVPAVGGGVAVLIKVIPHLLLIAGAIIFFTLGKEAAKDMFSFSEEQVKNMWPIITAALALSLALGGLAFKQYSNFVNRKTKFQKLISETLFFRNLATNRSVFSSIVDEAEEEEAKEMLLVAYHLTTMENRNPTVEELDDYIEKWIHDKFDVSVDFDIDGPVENLCEIKGLPDGGRVAGMPLLKLDAEKRCVLVPLEDANEILDCIWDGAFRHFS